MFVTKGESKKETLKSDVRRVDHRVQTCVGDKQSPRFRTTTGRLHPLSSPVFNNQFEV